MEDLNFVYGLGNYQHIHCFPNTYFSLTNITLVYDEYELEIFG